MKLAFLGLNFERWLASFSSNHPVLAKSAVLGSNFDHDSLPAARIILFLRNQRF